MRGKRESWEGVKSSLKRLGCVPGLQNQGHQKWHTPGGRSLFVYSKRGVEFPSRDYLRRISETLALEGLAL